MTPLRRLGRALAGALAAADAWGLRVTAAALAWAWDWLGLKRGHVLRLLVMAQMLSLMLHHYWLPTGLYVFVLLVQERTAPRTYACGVVGVLRAPQGLLVDPTMLVTCVLAYDWSGAVQFAAQPVWLYVLCTDTPTRPRRRPRLSALLPPLSPDPLTA